MRFWRSILRIARCASVDGRNETRLLSRFLSFNVYLNYLKLIEALLLFNALQAVVIIIICVLSLLTLYMLFLLCLDPLVSRRQRSYREHQNEEVNLVTSFAFLTPSSALTYVLYTPTTF